MSSQLHTRYWPRACVALVTLAVLLAGCVFHAPRNNTIDEAAADGFIYAIMSSSRSQDAYGDKLVIDRETADGGRERIYESDFKDLKLWRLQIADLDGDGQSEIVTAVRKTTHFDPEEKNRLFVFNYDGVQLTKKWTGSQIAGDWREFLAGDLLPIPGEELLFIESMPDGGERLSVYYWFDFGFVRLAVSEPYDRPIDDLAIAGENRLSLRLASSESRTLMVNNGRIVDKIHNP
jgi:hypothetical protein